MNEAEFEGFYLRTAPRIQAYLIRVTGSASLAEDLTQEACIRFLRSGFDEGEEACRRYLFRIASNAAVDHFRARSSGEQRLNNDGDR